MNEEFRLLCEKFDNSELTIINKKVSGSRGSFIHISEYFINVKYKNLVIEIYNELGNYNLGKVKLNLNQSYLIDFEITSINHFTNLFLRRKNLLKINCKDYKFKNILENLSNQSEIETIAKKNSFEPKIYTKMDNNIQYIITEYSLQFENKIGAIESLIKFHKLLIDELN